MVSSFLRRTDPHSLTETGVARLQPHTPSSATLRNLADASSNNAQLIWPGDTWLPTVVVMATAPELHDGIDPFTAMESLRAALAHAGIVLPSLAVDPASPTLRLVELGRVRADVALRLADALRGAAA
jgi:hypothetical protein